MNSSARQNLNPLSLVHFISPSCIHIHLNEFCKEKVFYILQHTHTQAKAIQCNFSRNDLSPSWNEIHTRMCYAMEKRWKKIDFGNWKGKKRDIPSSYLVCSCNIVVVVYVGRMYGKNKHQVNTSKLANTFYRYVFLTRVKLSVFPIHRCNVSGLAYLICLTLMPAYTS